MKIRLFIITLITFLFVSLFTLASCKLNIEDDESDEAPEYLTFTLMDDGTYSVSIVDAPQTDITTVTIPATYNKKPVTQIANINFANKIKLTPS